MKYLLFVILIAVGCNQDENPADLKGKWMFQAEKFSGTFEIINQFGSYYVKLGGEFTIGANKFTSTFEHPLILNGYNISEITLSDSKGVNFIGLTNITVSSDFISMMSTTQTYSECELCPNTIVSSSVRIARR